MDMLNYKRKEHLSASSASSFKRCPRYYFFSSGCRLQTPGDTGLALIFGSAIHAALPLAYSSVEEALKAFSKVWEGRDSLGDKKRNTARAKAMIVSFQNYHRSSAPYIPTPLQLSTELDLADRVSAEEMPFAFDIDRPFLVVGRIDNAGILKSTKEFFCIEYKTTSELSNRYLLSYCSNLQVLTYSLAFNIMGTQPCRGVIIEALRVSDKTSETMSFPIYVEPHLHERTIQFYQEVADEILECEKKENFPCDWSACNSYCQYGSVGYNCPFINLCQSEDYSSLVSAYDITEEKPFIIRKDGQQTY